MNTKVFLTTALLFTASVTSAFAVAKKVANSAVNVNGTWYYCGQYMDWCKGGSFNGADLGVLESLQLGGQSQAWDGNNNWESGQVQMSYMIDGGTVKVLYLDYWTHQYYNDSGETWMKFQSGTPATIDISGLAEGNHTLAVWFHCDNAYDSNNGNNFVANFTTPYKVANSRDISRVSNLSNGNSIAVQLDGLTLYKDGYCNTLCLPFGLTKSQYDQSPIKGAEIRELSSARVSGNTLTLNFRYVSATQDNDPLLEAGKPYIINWGNDNSTISNPTFTNVTISTNGAGSVPSNGVTFKGTFDQIDFTTAPDNILFVGDANTLYYPDNGTKIHPFHAYFELGVGVSQIKTINLNFDDEENGIQEITTDSNLSNPSNLSNSYITLDGRRLLSQPISPGIYIHNGRKVLIK